MSVDPSAFDFTISIHNLPRQYSYSEAALSIERIYFKGGKNSVDGSGSSLFVVEFHEGGICPAVHVYRMIMMMIVVMDATILGCFRLRRLV